MPPKTPVKKAPPAKGAAPAKGAPPANGAPAAKGAPANKKPPPANEKGKAPPKEGAAISQCRKQLNIPKKSGGPQKTINVEEVVGWALHGKVGCDYPDTAKIVRIFTSSTFTGKRPIGMMLKVHEHSVWDDVSVCGETIDHTQKANVMEYLVYSHPNSNEPIDTFLHMTRQLPYPWHVQKL